MWHIFLAICDSMVLISIDLTIFVICLLIGMFAEEELRWRFKACRNDDAGKIQPHPSDLVKGNGVIQYSYNLKETQ